MALLQTHRPLAKALLVSFLALAGLLAVFHSMALAHGGTLRAKGAQAGPYRLWVWTKPSPSRAGFLHASVLVMHPEAGAVVLDAAVRLSLEPVAAPGNATAAMAVAAGGGSIQHHADLEITEGLWRLIVEVESKLGSGSTVVELKVDPWQAAEKPFGHPSTGSG